MAHRGTLTRLAGAAAAGWMLLAGAPAGAQTSMATSRVSLSSSGQQGNELSWHPTVSATGRSIAFESFASNLVADDTNGEKDVFLRDVVRHTTRRISIASDGTQANRTSWDPAISADGRYIAFLSDATNLVPNDSNGRPDVFVHDRVAGTTTLVSVDSHGQHANDSSFDPAISADGRHIAFTSWATNLVSKDTNEHLSDVFVHDQTSGTTSRVSVSSSGQQAENFSFDPAISADGHDVAFSSWAGNLVPHDTNPWADVFVQHRS